MSIATISSTGKQNNSSGTVVMYSNYIELPYINNGNVSAHVNVVTSQPISTINDLWNYIITHGEQDSQYRYTIPCSGSYINALTPNMLGNLIYIKASSTDVNYMITACFYYIDSNGDITYGEIAGDYFANLISVVI